MADSDPTAPRKSVRSNRLLVGLALLLLVGLGAAAAAADGIGGVILLVGLVGLLLGGAAIVSGRARWAHLGSRRMGLMVALGGLGLALVGGALAPTHATPAASRTALGTLSSPSSSSAASSLVTSDTASSSTSALPTTSAPAPTTTATVVPTTTAPLPPVTYAPAPTTQPAPPPPAAPPVVVASPPPAVGGGSLGTAPIQKPPSGNFYRAGEYCPQVDSGKTTQDSAGRTLVCTNNNGLRWEYA